MNKQAALMKISDYFLNNLLLIFFSVIFFQHKLVTGRCT